MDINTVRGLISVALMIAFIGIVLWAYSSKRKSSFDEAANLPFADDERNARTLQESGTKKP
jgi:cytochrome c oxidase cbb3-type subunit IV